MTDHDSHPSAEAAPSRDADRLDKVVRIGQLLDLYGGLLTDRQRSFIVQHYQEDLSFGEIARGHGISRQAIHDAVKHAEAALEDYESKLSLLARGYVPPAGGRGAVGADAVLGAAASLRALAESIALQGGTIQDTEGVTGELRRLADGLERAAGAEEEANDVR